MAIGFTPKHTEEFSLNEITQKQFLVLANEVVKNMKWELSYISDSGLIAYTNNAMFARNSEIKIKTENGIVSLTSTSAGSEMADWGKNKENISDFKNNLDQIKSTLNQEEIDLKYEVLKEAFPTDSEDILKLPPATTTEQIKDFFSIFKPVQGFFITPILIDINILLFILMCVISRTNIILPDSESLLIWGANFRPMTLEGQWWRLLTCCFLHIGIFHLLMNMYALLYIGVLLEPLLGRTRFISAYLLSGITASVTSLWWHDLTISAGASGAVFGMYGVFLAMLTTNLIEKTARKSLIASIAVFVGYNLLYGMKGGIDNAAHIGGLIGGLIIGYGFIPSLKKYDQVKLKYSTIAILAMIILVASFTIYAKIPNDVGEYDKKIQDFSVSERLALEVYGLPEGTPKEKYLYELKNRGIYYWNENIQLIKSFEEMELPLEVRVRNKQLREYCELRIKSYELMYKAILEDTDQYKNEIENYNKQIEAKINQLAGKSPGN